MEPHTHTHTHETKMEMKIATTHFHLRGCFRFRDSHFLSADLSVRLPFPDGPRSGKLKKKAPDFPNPKRRQREMSHFAGRVGKLRHPPQPIWRPAVLF